MARKDWGKLQRAWAVSGLSVRAFCEKNDLPFGTAKRYFTTKVRNDYVGITNDDEFAQSDPSKREKSDPNGSGSKFLKNTVTTGSLSDLSPNDGEEKPKRKRGGQRGNKNAFVHGLFTRAFGDLVQYSEQADDDFKIKLFRLAQLRALESHTKFITELKKLQQDISERENTTPTELDLDRIASLENRIDSSFDKATYFASKEIQLVSNLTNIEATIAAKNKINVQIKQIKVDTTLKEKGIALAGAKTEQARAQTELAKLDLDSKRKENLGDDDDLGMSLDEIMDLDDDEIVARFKENGGEIQADD
ncbi:hypothetical protein LZS85_15595 [Aliivibrio fischeri]|uniref:hypothetical protein n=1 Tax=Aliivibrio fischeri TaxID=668 RepID=UPI001F39F960|nr:hypothetical protein [Aliivibrio fischeri]MCE7567547.1 hypothetical protein [Aliivibrio fischeri]